MVGSRRGATTAVVVAWCAAAVLVVGASPANAAPPGPVVSGSPLGARALSIVDHGSLAHPPAIPAAAGAPVVAGGRVQAQFRVSFGWGIYVTYTRTEVKRIASMPIQRAKYSSILCAPIPQATLALACGLYVYDAASAIATTFRRANRQGACVQTRYATPSVVIGWKVVRC